MSIPKTPTTDQIRAWIDNSSFYDDIEGLECEDAISKIIDTSDLLTEIQDKIHDIVLNAYNNGLDDYEVEDIEDTDDIPPQIADALTTSFVIQKFQNCKTLEEFQLQYSYIYSEYLTHMK